MDIMCYMSAEYISLKDAAKLIPSRTPGRPVVAETVRRWIINGLSVKGQKIQLAGTRQGGIWYTTADAVSQFVRTCNGGTEPIVPPRRTGGMSAARRRLIARGMYGQKAKRELLGVPAKGRSARPVPSLPASSPVRSEEGESHGGAVNRRGADASEVVCAAIGLQQPTRQGVIETT